MKRIPTIIAVIISILLLLIPVFCLWILAAFSDLESSFLVPIVGVLLVVLIGLVTFSISNKKWLKKSIILLSVIILSLFGAMEGENLYKHKYIPSISVSNNIGWYGKYMPFTNSKELSHLDKESSLHFSKDDKFPVVDGATALLPIYCSFVEAVYPSDCEIKSFVKYNTTIGAYENLIEGKTDIIFVAQPSEDQIESAKKAGIEFNMYPIGYEAFVFLVNKNNSVDGLTLQQVKDIYTGKITNWKSVGGKNRLIRPFQRDSNSGSQTAFLAVMGKEIDLLPPETHKVSGMDGLIDVVSDYQNHDNAIGYSFRYYVEKMKNNKNIKMLKLNGIAPTLENIRNKTYPITDNFYAITIKGRESEETKKFINWILSEQGQELIEKVGYVALD